MLTAIHVKSIANREAYSWKEWAVLLLYLGKIRISLLVTFTTLSDYILAKGHAAIQMLLPMTAIFFLACGSCALNQYQEREADGLMERTRGRPLPSGKLTPGAALAISFTFLSFGFLLLLYGADVRPFALGLFAVLWYNGVYTPLKRRTAFASIPGALIGVVPPLFGWLSGGGHLFDPRIWAVSFFFFVWQVPHFWLLLLNSGKDYEKAGYPSLTGILGSLQLSRMIFTWIFATAVTCVTLPLFGVVGSDVIQGGLFLAGFWLVWKASRLLRTDHPEFSFRSIFRSINTYAFLVMLLFILDRLFQ